QVQQSAMAQGRKCYAEWAASLNPATLPYETLGHSGMQINFGPPEAGSLSQAKANASLIVLATVMSISPQPVFATEVTLSVTKTLKGQAGNTIKVLQASHLEPQDNWQSVIIVDAYNAP